LLILLITQLLVVVPDTHRVQILRKGVTSLRVSRSRSPENTHILLKLL